MSAKKSPFIQGFKQPTLTKNSLMTLADVRGDGQGKLVIWQQQQQSLIVYRGANRQLQKSVKLKNVSGIIQYQDQQRNCQATLGLSAQNGFYIFRGLTESFRLRIPDIIATVEEQMIWSQYENDPSKLKDQLLKLKAITLSQTASCYIGVQTIQRQKQIIQKVFSEGINEKDSISAMGLLRASDSNFLGNIILGSQLRRLYILDNFGHSILNTRILPFVPAFLFGHGQFTDKYIIICIGRNGEMCVYQQKDQDEPAQRYKSHIRVIHAVLSYPQLLIVQNQKSITVNIISSGTLKLITKKYSLRFSDQPLKAQFLKHKGQKMIIVTFPKQIRLYNQKQLRYTFVPEYLLYNSVWGSFAREQNCLILLYQYAGFEVFILHRQFNAKETYQSNKLQIKQNENIPLPKKTTHFLSYWNQQQDQSLLYKYAQRNMQLLKWRTLRQKFSQSKKKNNSKIQINTKILGLGPKFTIQIQIQNLSQQVLYNIGLMYIFNADKIQLQNYQNKIDLLPPMNPAYVEVKLRSISMLAQGLQIYLVQGIQSVSTLVHLPSCQQFE